MLELCSCLLETVGGQRSFLATRQSPINLLRISTLFPRKSDLYGFVCPLHSFLICLFLFLSFAFFLFGLLRERVRDSLSPLFVIHVTLQV